MHNLAMEQKSLECLCYVLSNWSDMDVRTVPGVMYQVRVGSDENHEYRFHCFIDCNETYVHNHRFSFDSLCLAGGYIERLWEIVPDHPQAVTYCFSRASGNHLNAVFPVSGALRFAGRREHFPGNVLHVDTHQFHSISTLQDADNEVVTFVARRLDSLPRNTFILSSTDTIEAPVEEIRRATVEENQAAHQKLQQMQSKYQ
jgi:hypothetical protein